MKFVEHSALANAETAERKLVEIATGIEAMQDRR
jgi:hypothetical protein